MPTIQAAEKMTVQLAGTKAFPCTNYKTKEPKLNSEGLQQWSFNIMLPTAYRFEQIPVKTYAKADPLEGSAMGDSVELSGLAIDFGYMTEEGGGRRQWWSLNSQSVLVKKARA